MLIKPVRRSGISLAGQICAQLRAQIHAGSLPAGYKMPSTRKIHAEYNISRNVVLEAYEQLTAEGYLVSRKGSGTYVADNISPVIQLQTEQGTGVDQKNIAIPKVYDFSAGTPDLDYFPLTEWARTLRRAVLGMSREEMRYPPPGGSPKFRQVLGEYLHRNKGLVCNWRQIFICNSSYQALILANRIMQTLKGNNSVHCAIENPSYNLLSKMISRSGINIHPIETDNAGLNPDGILQLGSCDFTLITPSHMFPSGIVYPIGRRIRLCETAAKKDFYIVENDYEGAVRLRGTPIPSLAGIDAKRVLHAGTFSQLMYPGIRLGYLVVPEHLQTIAEEAGTLLGYQVASEIQKGVAHFIENGQLLRYWKKVRQHLLKKQRYFMEQIINIFGTSAKITGNDNGLYLTVELKGLEISNDICRKIAASTVEVDFARNHYWPPGIPIRDNRILLGYTLLSEELVPQGLTELKKLLYS